MRPRNEIREAALNDARMALAQTAAKGSILEAFVEWWDRPSHDESEESESGASRPPTARLAERLRTLGRDDLAAFALGPWPKPGPIDPNAYQFAILLGESFADVFVNALLAGTWRATNFFYGLNQFGAWDAYDLTLRGVLRTNIPGRDAAFERLRQSVERAKLYPTHSIPHDERMSAQVHERIRRYRALPDIDEAWPQPSDIPIWPDYSFLWDVLLDVRPEETLALMGQMPHPLLIRSSFGNERLAERPDEIARLISAAPIAFTGSSFHASGAVAVLLLELAWTAIERTAHNADGSVRLVEIGRPELLAPAAERCHAVTETILNALFLRPDAVPLAWAWLERMVSDLRLQRVPANATGERLNLPALSIVSLAKRLHLREDDQAWINERPARWRIYRLCSVVAVATFEQAPDPTRTASILESALTDGDLDYAQIDTAMGDDGDVVAMIGGQAISTFQNPAGWFAGIWQKLRRTRERNWRVGDSSRERNTTGELCALWGLAALKSQGSTQRQILWASVEKAVRDAWQTDTYAYAPNWSTVLLRLFKTFEPSSGEGVATAEQQLSQALLPYIAADLGFLSLILELNEGGWSLDALRSAVALAGFDLRALVTELLDMKERVFKLPQAKNDRRIPRIRKLAEALSTFKCIYCLEVRGRGSYTKVEHVLPQSFGTFEPQNFTLRNVVCDDCNQYFGSNLEFHLGRDTYEGQLRFTHGVKDANEFKTSGRQSRIVLKLAEGPFAGCFVNRRFSREKGEIEVTPLPQVGFLLAPTDHYAYFLLADIPSLAELQEKGFNGERPRSIRGVAVDPEVLTQFLGERGIPFRFADFDHSPSDRPETILCELEGTIDQVIRRAIAKIAFNYLARWQGPEFLHRPEFDVARRYIRHGTLPDYEMMRIDEEAILDGEPLEGPRALGHIITVDWTNVHSVLAQVALFNWLSYRISLTKEFPDPRPEIRRGHIFDVTRRKIHELGSRPLPLRDP